MTTDEPSQDSGSIPARSPGWRSLATLLLLTLGLRAIDIDQPIVENYVGRQVPTAMVARNLERGSGILYPQLDTGPFPNYFVVEPPLYQEAVIGLRRLLKLSLSGSGRITSALGMALAVAALYGLTLRREGPTVALLAGLALAVFPVGVRFGRAFQPDALMLGSVCAGLWCWESARTDRRWLLPAWLLTAAGLSMKVLAAHALLPLLGALLRGSGWRTKILAVSSLAPALLWYVHAGRLLDAGASRASLDNQAIWLATLAPTWLLERETYLAAGRNAFVRAFTPLGLPLGLYGLWKLRRDRLWSWWAASAALMLLVVLRKSHHEYYWLALAPALAAGLGRVIAPTGEGVRRVVLTGLAFIILSCIQSWSTWRTPTEWASIVPAAEAVRRHVPSDALLVAPEGLLFQADRRGCRLEFSTSAVIRAAGEWGGRPDEETAAALVEFYRSRGAAFLADLVPESPAPGQTALHEWARSRYAILEDRDGVILADLRQPRDSTWPKMPGR